MQSCEKQIQLRHLVGIHFVVALGFSSDSPGLIK